MIQPFALCNEKCLLKNKGQAEHTMRNAEMFGWVEIDIVSPSKTTLIGKPLKADQGWYSRPSQDM